MQRARKEDEKEKGEEKEAKCTETKPPVTLQQAIESADLLARFIAENPSAFKPGAEFEIYKKVQEPLSNMLLKEIRQRRQGMLDRVSQ